MLWGRYKSLESDLLCERLIHGISSICKECVELLHHLHLEGLVVAILLHIARPILLLKQVDQRSKLSFDVTQSRCIALDCQVFGGIRGSLLIKVLRSHQVSGVCSDRWVSHILGITCHILTLLLCFDH